MNKFWCILVLFSIVLVSCKEESPFPAPDVSKIVVDLEIRRFEEDLMDVDTNNVEAGIQLLEEKYAAFAPLYFGNILGAYNSDIPFPEFVKGFIQYEGTQYVVDTLNNVFGDFKAYESAFTQAGKYFQYYFPDQPMFDVTTFTSDFSYGAFIYEGPSTNSLACGLDLFLGQDFNYKGLDPMNAMFSDYLTRTYTPDHLVSKTIQTLAQDLVGPVTGNTLLDHVIHNGKKLFILKRLLPETPDSIIHEVSTEQMTWLEGNEANIYAFFLDEELFYETNWPKISYYVNYAPSSPGMPNEAPGRTGDYLGLKIIETYMLRYPQTSLQNLIDLRNPQALLDRARYKPRN